MTTERTKIRHFETIDSLMKLYVCSILLVILAHPATGAEDSKLSITPDPQAAAQFQLARAYLRGEGVPKDPGKAFELMKAAADHGDAEAIGGLGYFYSIGLVVPKDDEQAMDWFRKGAEKGSAKAQLNYGNYLVDAKVPDYREMTRAQMHEQGRQWIRKAADQGLPDAGLTYGRIFYFGDYGQPQDYQKALVYLKPAAESGIADAQNILGSIYQCGAGTPIDEVAAEHWYRKAALQGHSRAQGNLGMLLGPLVEDKATRIEALAWLLMASEQNQITATKALSDAEPALKVGEMAEAKMKQVELTKLVTK